MARDLRKLRFDRALHLPLDDFVSGGDNRKVDIDPIFGQKLHAVLENYRPATLRRGKINPAVFGQGYSFRIVETDTDHGIVLLTRTNTIVGAYLGCALAILPQHRGRGLGAELVFEFALTFGFLPAWLLDVAAYSPAGFAADRRAWYLARSVRFATAKRLNCQFA